MLLLSALKFTPIKGYASAAASLDGPLTNSLRLTKKAFGSF
jgi:hypothetical protein